MLATMGSPCCAAWSSTIAGCAAFAPCFRLAETPIRPWPPRRKLLEFHCRRWTRYGEGGLVFPEESCARSNLDAHLGVLGPRRLRATRSWVLLRSNSAARFHRAGCETTRPTRLTCRPRHNMGRCPRKTRSPARYTAQVSGSCTKGFLGTGRAFLQPALPRDVARS